MEYTLVFRRPIPSAVTSRAAARPWVAVRPALTGAHTAHTNHAARPTAEQPTEPHTGARPHARLAQVFVVPVCSALGMDGLAYDRFLIESGAVAAALRVLGATTVERPAEADDARKEIQALVMAAEVQHIVDQLSA